MTRRFRSLSLVLFTVAFLGAAPPVVASDVLAGAARATFVLPKQVPLAGYSRRRGAPSQGVHDPVGVRAVVLRDDDTTAALVSCDLLIIDEQFFELVRQRLIAQGLPQDLVLILAATHTHSGPGAYGTKFLEKVSMGHFDPGVRETLVESITQTILEAHRSLAPVRTSVRSVMTSGLVTNRVDPAGITDGELTVCAFYPVGRPQPLAVIVGFAAHPTTLGAWNRQMSADYPGVLVRDIEQRLPPAVCLFFAGAVGDQAPVKRGDGFALAQWLGQTLGDQAVTLLEGEVGASPPRSLRALQVHVRLPPPRVRLGRLTLPRWLGRQFVDDDATLSLIAVGNTVWLGVPCDLAVSLGSRLKEVARARGLHPVVVGFADDYIGYCIPDALYRTEAYEARMAFNGPGTGERLIAELTQMLNTLTTSDGR